MADRVIVDREKLTAIADGLRGNRSDGTALSLDQMAVLASGQSGVLPAGSIEITENGTYDVTNKAEAVVNVGGEVEFYQMRKNSVTDTSSCYHYYPKHFKFPDGATNTRKTVFSFADELESIDGNDISSVTEANFIFSCKNLRRVIMPKLSSIEGIYFIRQQNITSQIEEIQFGSFGHPFTKFNNSWNCLNNRSGCRITIYTSANNLDELPDAISGFSNYASQNTSNCTLVYRNSETGEVLE